MKRLFANILLLSLLLSAAFPVLGETDGSFSYRIDNESVIITSCRSEESGIVVPAKINGLPVVAIDDFAFSGIGAKTITLPYGLKTVGQKAFSQCQSLTEIDLPETVEEVGEYAFENCASLQIAVLPSNLTEIRDSCFAGCTALKTVSMPKMLKTVGDRAFSDCTALESIAFPETLEIIGESAFASAKSLINLYLPESLTEIRALGVGFYYEGIGFQVNPDTVVHGAEGSAAQAYCKENGISFHITERTALCETCGFEAQQPQLSFRYGDLDNDNRIISKDAVLLGRYLAEWQVEIKKISAADVNGDGEITASDAVLLSRYLAHWEIDSLIEAQ